MSVSDVAATGMQLPLTSGQRAIWFDQLLHDDQPLYNMSGCMRIFGPLDRDRFTAACEELVRRNDVLRLVLRAGADLPTQEILDAYVCDVRYIDLSATPANEAWARDWLDEEIDKPLALFDRPLFEFALLKLSDDEYWWYHLYHHIILDAYGHSLLAAQLASIYSGAIDESPPHPYVDYVRYDAAQQETDRWTADLAYWTERFPTLPEPLVERKAFGERIEHQRHVLTLERAFYNRINAFAADVGVSTFHVLLGALYVCFTRAGSRNDFAVGLPTLNRPSAAFKATAGLFANVTPAWFALGTDIAGVDLLKTIAAELRRDYRHQRIPLSEINRCAGLYRDGRPQMFDLVMTYQKHSYDVLFDGHRVEQISLRHGLKTPLMLEVSEYNEERDVSVNVDYSVSAFDRGDIVRFGALLETAIAALIADRTLAVRDLPIGMTGPLTLGRAPATGATTAAVPERTTLGSAAIEAMLSGIWQSELALERVGLDDNIFDLGGHSLVLVRVAHRIAVEIGSTLSITQMFMYPTIRTLTAALAGDARSGDVTASAQERGAARRRRAAERAEDRSA